MTKDQKRNVILMLLLLMALAIGIATRYKYVKKEVREALEHYLPQTSDTINHK